MTTQNNQTTQSPKEPLTAAILARVSTSRQQDEATIESQIAEIKARIESDGNVLPNSNIFIDDGWTGEMLARPGMDAMRDAAAAGLFQALYVYDRGRISRMFAYQEIVIEEITNRGIQFVTLHDVQAQTPEEKVLQAMQGVFAEYERVKIVERMRRGKLYKARNGIVINGQAPFGYSYVKKTDTTLTHYEVNEEEAEIVRKIFQWVGIERISLNEVIKRLYDLGVKPKKRKSDFWTKGPILRLLRSEAYTEGLIYYNKSEAIVAKNPFKHDKYKKIKRGSRRVRSREDWIPYKVTPLISNKSLYEKVQEVLDYNQRYTHALKKQHYNYLLSGLAYCGCGQRRAGDGTSKYGHYYYRCACRIHKPVGVEGGCHAQGVNAVILDGLFWKKLREYLSNPAYLRQQAQDWLLWEANQNESLSRERTSLFDSVEKTKEEESRYAKAYGVGSLEFEQFQELVKDVKRKRLSYQTRIAKLDKESANPNILDSQLDLICEEAKSVLGGLDFADKKKVVLDIIDKVILHESGQVEVRGHLPLFAQELGQQSENLLKLGSYAASRNCRSTKCREVYAL